MKTTWLFRSSYIKNVISKGGNVSVVAFDDGKEFKEQLESIGANVYSITHRNICIKLILLNFIILFRLGRVSSNIQCHFISTILMSLPSLLFFSRKVTIVVEGLGSFLETRPFMLKVLKKVFSCFRFNRIFMNSDERLSLGDPGDLVMYGIGIELDDYYDLVQEKESGNQSLSICFAGRLIKDKGINDVFSVVELCLENGLDVKLNIFGDTYPGNPSSLTDVDIAKISERFGDKVHFWGFKDDLKRYLSSNDLLILPSRREGFPVVVMEASALGIPSIAYNVSGCRDAIRDSVNGFLVDYGDIMEIYKKLLIFINLTASEKNALSSKAKDYAMENYSRSVKDEALLASVLSHSA
ncbi:glycosyltransferase [Vibrio splendidus]|uniref:glycosyltransferase n=1 Tax=Vibrio splendidus TaxID=29497 RepID=UPI0011B242E0|nr:glycosyltransferase [Vibrio splendidus]